MVQCYGVAHGLSVMIYQDYAVKRCRIELERFRHSMYCVQNCRYLVHAISRSMEEYKFDGVCSSHEKLFDAVCITENFVAENNT